LFGADPLAVAPGSHSGGLTVERIDFPAKTLLSRYGGRPAHRARDRDGMVVLPYPRTVVNQLLVSTFGRRGRRLVTSAFGMGFVQGLNPRRSPSSWRR
jgi:hypothetical protein